MVRPSSADGKAVQIVDRDAIAQARLAHLAKQHDISMPAVASSLPPSTYARNTALLEMTPVRAVTVIDLTDD